MAAVSPYSSDAPSSLFSGCMTLRLNAAVTPWLASQAASRVGLSFTMSVPKRLRLKERRSLYGVDKFEFGLASKSRLRSVGTVGTDTHPFV